MRWRTLVLSGFCLGLLFSFQNCSAPTSMDPETHGDELPLKEKVSLSGRYKVSDFIATSSCPDVEAGEFTCAAIYKELVAKVAQTVEFMADGTLMVEGACNTYYSSYVLSTLGSIGKFQVDKLNGTSNSCSGDQAEEESLLVYRLTNAVRVIEDGPQSLTIYTDQSSALRFVKN